VNKGTVAGVKTDKPKIELLKNHPFIAWHRLIFGPLNARPTLIFKTIGNSLIQMLFKRIVAGYK